MWNNITCYYIYAVFIISQNKKMKTRKRTEKRNRKNWREIEKKIKLRKLKKTLIKIGKTRSKQSEKENERGNWICDNNHVPVISNRIWIHLKVKSLI